MLFERSTRTATVGTIFSNCTSSSLQRLGAMLGSSTLNPEGFTTSPPGTGEATPEPPCPITGAPPPPPWGLTSCPPPPLALHAASAESATEHPKRQDTPKWYLPK